MKKILNNINFNFILSLLLVIVSILYFRQCENTKEAQNEISRIENNQLALKDTIKNYKDKWGNSVGEIRGLSYTVDELKDSLEFEKNKPPITIIKYKTKIEEKIVEVPVVVRDTIIGDYNSLLEISSADNWGKSSRSIDIKLPFYFSEDTLTYGNADINLNQNIWLNASLFKDKKSQEVFVKLKTDYPNVTFNNAQGILISDEFKKLEKNNRKTVGIGLQMGLGFNGNELGPYIGVGLHYSPTFLQW